MDLTSSKWLFGKWQHRFNARSQRCRCCSGETPAIPLSSAACQEEQIEFVFLRWLVEALNCMLVARLIKAVRVNGCSCEPPQTGLEPEHMQDSCFHLYSMLQTGNQPHQELETESRRWGRHYTGCLQVSAGKLLNSTMKLKTKTLSVQERVGGSCTYCTHQQ